MSVSPNNHLSDSRSDQVRVILVEDSDDDVFFFRRILRHTGEAYDFVHFPEGKSAIDYLARTVTGEFNGVFLMFLDLKMPVINGFDVLAWIKQNPIPQQLAVCVLSGSDDARDRSRARALGAMDYLVKPISLGVLRERIRSLREAAISGMSPANEAEANGVEP